VKFGVAPKLAANWFIGELSAALNREGLDPTESKIDAKRFAGLLRRVEDSTISSATAKIVFAEMWESGSDADAIINAKGLRQITDTSAIERVITEVMKASPAQLADYHSGKDKLFGFFVGQVMKATGGKANPAQVNELLRKMLAG
jgi:aspartyl-tRNA(Asn)/glutamyl-tRNA(Gln) amidotransferase subunit B